MNRLAFTLLAACLLLSGLAACEHAQQLGTAVAASVEHEPVTVVIPPGHPVAVDGAVMKVFGTDECPKEHPAVSLLLGSPAPQATGCIVVSPRTTAVTVLVQDAQARDGLRAETWAVERHAGKPGAFSFKRQGGPAEQPALQAEFGATVHV